MLFAEVSQDTELFYIAGLYSGDVLEMAGTLVLTPEGGDKMIAAVVSWYRCLKSV